MVTMRHRFFLQQRSLPALQAVAVSESVWWHELAWVGVAAVVGFATTAVLAGWLELSRSWLVLVYAPVVVTLFVAYARWNHIDIQGFVVHHWRWGIVAGVVAGALLVMAVQREDGSARPEGFRLAWDVFWLGIVYGFADALLLSVLPVMATWRTLARRGWTNSWVGKVGVGSLALVASMLVTAACHLGYPEFQGVDVKDPLVGNTIITFSFIVSGSPIAAVVSHIAMHIAAVFHGAAGTTQLPPHY
jgi:hypothetical protein